MRTTVLLQSNSSSTLNKNIIEVNLQTPIRNVESVRLIMCALPNTVYTNNSYDISYMLQLVSGSIINISISHGKYSLDELMVEMEHQLNLNAHTGSSLWSVSYNHIRFHVVITNNSLRWRFVDMYQNNLQLLGYTLLSNDYSLIQEGFQAPRMSSNKLIGIRIHQLPGGVEIANLHAQYTFVIPFPAVSEQITYLGRDALRGQKVTYNQHGIDLKNLRVELMQTESLEPLCIQSDWGIMLEIDSSDDYMS